MNTHLNAARRTAEIAQLRQEPVDVVVIGGGFTGVGVALDAASRGLSVAVIERADLANGTSRFSSKLAHGGLRYLAKAQVGIAWESARERGILFRNTHLVHPVAMLYPLGTYAKRTDGFLAAQGFRAGNALRAFARTPKSVLPAPRKLSPADTLRQAPAVNPTGLRGGLLSWDGQLEDDARLVVALARTAAGYGAKIITYAQVTTVERGRVDVVDQLTGEPFTVRANTIVNAAGVWADGLTDEVKLRPSKGSHLLVPGARLGNPTAAITVPVPGHFGRFVFAVPWPDGLVMIGLTDEPAEGPVPDDALPDAEEEEFLLDTINQALAQPLTSDDVAGRFAGFRPLLEGKAGSSADLSRKHAVIEDAETGMLTIVGGKLTAYRQMAQDVIDRITAVPCQTRDLPLVGCDRTNQAPGGDIPERLVRRFGSEAAQVAALGDTTPISADIAVTPAEIRWAVEAELAITAADILDRRTRIGLVPAWRPALRSAIAELAPELS